MTPGKREDEVLRRVFCKDGGKGKVVYKLNLRVVTWLFWWWYISATMTINWIILGCFLLFPVRYGTRPHCSIRSCREIWHQTIERSRGNLFPRKDKMSA